MGQTVPSGRSSNAVSHFEQDRETVGLPLARVQAGCATTDIKPLHGYPSRLSFPMIQNVDFAYHRATAGCESHRHGSVDFPSDWARELDRPWARCCDCDLVNRGCPVRDRQGAAGRCRTVTPSYARDNVPLGWNRRVSHYRRCICRREMRIRRRFDNGGVSYFGRNLSRNSQSEVLKKGDPSPPTLENFKTRRD